MNSKNRKQVLDYCKFDNGYTQSVVSGVSRPKGTRHSRHLTEDSLKESKTASVCRYVTYEILCLLNSHLSNPKPSTSSPRLPLSSRAGTLTSTPVPPHHTHPGKNPPQASLALFLSGASRDPPPSARALKIFLATFQHSLLPTELQHASKIRSF